MIQGGREAWRLQGFFLQGRQMLSSNLMAVLPICCGVVCNAMFFMLPGALCNMGYRISLKIILTLRGTNKLAAIYKCIFLNENVWISIEIALKFVP